MPQAAEHLAALDAFGVEDAVVAVTRSDLADPGEHRLDEPLVARHVDEGHLTGAGQLRPAVPEGDRQAATPLFLEPVRIGARQRPNQR